MINAQTVEQFYILRWLETRIVPELFEITLVDRYTVRIKDAEGKYARATYVEKDNIVLSEEK
ncbi:hypothetical protein [Paenibacillus sp. FSL R7-0128]|uniref:hypothetical protein n=1 Tax=Paenibacillus sp. FSL R7-0128 TaxID=2954529 RepID=UPI0030F897FA